MDRPFVVLLGSFSGMCFGLAITMWLSLGFVLLGMFLGGALGGYITWIETKKTEEEGLT